MREREKKKYCQARARLGNATMAAARLNDYWLVSIMRDGHTNLYYARFARAFRAPGYLYFFFEVRYRERALLMQLAMFEKVFRAKACFSYEKNTKCLNPFSLSAPTRASPEHIIINNFLRRKLLSVSTHARRHYGPRD